MCVQSQYYLSARDMLDAFIPENHRGLLVFVRGYIDESYSKRVFTLSCLMAESSDWNRFQSLWKKVIVCKNQILKRQGRQQLSRYHAADCASCLNEFAGWSVEEQISFVRSLLSVFQRHTVNVISYSVPLK